MMLVVLAGRPGTGKTTLSRLVAGRLGAALLRVDAVEAVVVRCGLAEPPVGVVGYAVAHEVAASTLRVGTPVVVDAVNPVPQARSGWRGLAAETGARLVVVELTTADAAEHRRRVEARTSDLDGLTVPTWQQASQGEYVPWDEDRDGPRLLLDTSGGVEVLVDRVLAECVPDAGTAEAVLDAARRRADALVAGDPSVLRAMLHPAFTWTTFCGAVLDRDTYVRGNTDGSLVWHAQTLYDPRVVVTGGTAVVVAQVDDDVERDGVRQTFRLRLTQTWVADRAAGWICLAGHAHAPTT